MLFGLFCVNYHKGFFKMELIANITLVSSLVLTFVAFIGTCVIDL
nr:MAG TPA: hypothetical protein [Caudoviricetes sp.]